MDVTDYIAKLKNEINIYGNKIALQRFNDIKARIIECIENKGITDLNDRLSGVPTKKGRPPIKKVVHVLLKA